MPAWCVHLQVFHPLTYQFNYKVFTTTCQQAFSLESMPDAPDNAAFTFATNSYYYLPERSSTGERTWNPVVNGVGQQDSESLLHSIHLKKPAAINSLSAAELNIFQEAAKCILLFSAFMATKSPLLSPAEVATLRSEFAWSLASDSGKLKICRLVQKYVRSLDSGFVIRMEEEGNGSPIITIRS